MEIDLYQNAARLYELSHEEAAQQLLSNESVWKVGPQNPPSVAAWAVLRVQEFIPPESCWHLQNLLTESRTNPLLRFWLQCSESWHYARMAKQAEISAVIKCPDHYVELMSREASLVKAFPDRETVQEAIQYLTHPHDPRLYAKIPHEVVSCLSEPEQLCIQVMFIHHYWDLMLYVLPKRWDMVEYLVHTFGWTVNEFEAMMRSLPKGLTYEPSPYWINMWWTSGILRPSLVMFVARDSPAWTLACFKNLFNNDYRSPYAVSIFDRFRLQFLPNRLIKFAFTIMDVVWESETVTEDMAKGAVLAKSIQLHFREN